ncbi:MAG: asparaginase domain-containing protein [Lachnospiraceae bacterium]
MKIGVIFTGGTIGSAVNENGYISTKGKDYYLLLDMYRKKRGDQHEFITKSPYCILSENLQQTQLVQLIQSVDELLEEKVDGIIVTHGTDTLQYTAGILGYVFSEAAIPVLLVSSNYVLANPAANGFCNFDYAMEFIKGAYGKGVFVSYCNTGDNPKIHRATRLMAPLSYSDDVYSIENSYYGYFYGETGNVKGEDNGVIFRKNKEAEENIHSLSMFQNMDKKEIELNKLSDMILQVKPYVGMNYPELTQNVKAILHDSYHSGTIGITGELIRFAKEAKELHIPFYLVGLSSKVTTYETVSMYEEYGIIPLFDTAYIAQYCKLWLGLSNGFDILKLMGRNYGYDHIM